MWIQHAPTGRRIDIAEMVDGQWWVTLGEERQRELPDMLNECMSTHYWSADYVVDFD